jgi:hypothetical protein
MANSRIGVALDRVGWGLLGLAEEVDVGPTLECWITKEHTSHRRIAITAAKWLGEDQIDLRHNRGRRLISDGNYGEVVKSSSRTRGAAQSGAFVPSDIGRSLDERYSKRHRDNTFVSGSVLGHRHRHRHPYAQRGNSSGRRNQSGDHLFCERN